MKLKITFAPANEIIYSLILFYVIWISLFPDYALSGLLPCAILMALSGKEFSIGQGQSVLHFWTGNSKNNTIIEDNENSHQYENLYDECYENSFIHVFSGTFENALNEFANKFNLKVNLSCFTPEELSIIVPESHIYNTRFDHALEIVHWVVSDKIRPYGVIYVNDTYTFFIKDIIKCDQYPECNPDQDREIG